MQTKTAQKTQVDVLPVGQALLKNGFIDVIKQYTKKDIQGKHEAFTTNYHEASAINTIHYSVFLRMINKRNTAKNSALFFSDLVACDVWVLNNYFKLIPEKPLREIVKARNCGVSYDDMYVVEIAIHKAKEIKDPLVYTNIGGKILKIAFWD